MDKLADLVEDCIEQNGIETYEELIEAFGTPQKVVVEQLEFIDEKGLRARARQKHRTRNVVLYMVFLAIITITAIFVIEIYRQEDYRRGIKTKIVYDELYTDSLSQDGVAPVNIVVKSPNVQVKEGDYFS